MAVVDSKVCSRCRVRKPAGEFHLHRKDPSGLYAHCKQCKALMNSEKRANNPEPLRAASLRWYRQNRDHARAKSAEWKAANKAKTADAWKRWYERNRDRVLSARDPAKAAAACRERQARKLQATPKWANRFFVEEIYRLAALRSRLTGTKWVVDHIVPLKHKLVCGLHVEANLQVTTFAYNARKGNRFTPGDLTPDRGPRLESAWER